MADPSLANLTHLQAVMIGLLSILIGNFLYQASNDFIAPRAPRLSAAVWITGLLAVSVALTQLLNGRAAFLHIGAMLGVIMATNVARTILPSQRALVASIEQGGDADEAKRLSDKAKRVSIHNNYFTFPVILLMVSNHFPSLYSNRYSIGLVLIIIVVGALIRHIMNIRFTWAPWKPALAATSLSGLLLLYGVMQLGNSPNFTFGPGPSRLQMQRPSTAIITAVSFEEVRHVIDRRCAVCHSQNPVDLSFGIAPGGVMFDTPEQILARRSRILERAVVTRTMPLANKTHITDEERSVLEAWARQ